MSGFALPFATIHEITGKENTATGIAAGRLQCRRANRSDRPGLMRYKEALPVTSKDEHGKTSWLN
jgi:hypothetical protein